MGTCGGLAQHFTAFLRRGDRGMGGHGELRRTVVLVQGPGNLGQAQFQPISVREGMFEVASAAGSGQDAPTEAIGRGLGCATCTTTHPSMRGQGTNRVAQENAIFSAWLGFLVCSQDSGNIWPRHWAICRSLSPLGAFTDYVPACSGGCSCLDRYSPALNPWSARETGKDCWTETSLSEFWTVTAER